MTLTPGQRNLWQNSHFGNRDYRFREFEQVSRLKSGSLILESSMLEQLEIRRLLSGANLTTTGTLQITGTIDADTLAVGLNRDNFWRNFTIDNVWFFVQITPNGIYSQSEQEDEKKIVFYFFYHFYIN